jgi:hypothetical protein
MTVLQSIEFGKCNPAIGINKDLLVDPAYTYDRCYLKIREVL